MSTMSILAKQILFSTCQTLLQTQQPTVEGQSEGSKQQATGYRMNSYLLSQAMERLVFPSLLGNDMIIIWAG